MTIATIRQPLFEASVCEGVRPLRARADFEAFFAEWFPRVHGFVALRLKDRHTAEAVTRAVLEAALRAELVGESEQVARRLLALAKAEIAAAHGAHAFVTRTPRFSQ